MQSLDQAARFRARLSESSGLFQKNHLVGDDFVFSHQPVEINTRSDAGSLAVFAFPEDVMFTGFLTTLNESAHQAPLDIIDHQADILRSGQRETDFRLGIERIGAVLKQCHLGDRWRIYPDSRARYEHPGEDARPQWCAMPHASMTTIAGDCSARKRANRCLVSRRRAETLPGRCEMAISNTDFARSTARPRQAR